MTGGLEFEGPPVRSRGGAAKKRHPRASRGARHLTAITIESGPTRCSTLIE